MTSNINGKQKHKKGLAAGLSDCLASAVCWFLALHFLLCSFWLGFHESHVPGYEDRIHNNIHYHLNFFEQ
jgi:hypothetical protein